MLEGIEIMLKRMESHPEEFMDDSPYAAAFRAVCEYLTPEETVAVKEGLAKAHRSCFTGEVMRIMSGGVRPSNRGPFPNPYHQQYQSMTAAETMRHKLLNSLSKSTGTFAPTQPSPFGAVPSNVERESEV